MNQLKKIIHYNQLISKNLNKNQFILSKDKTSLLSFIEITPNNEVVWDYINPVYRRADDDTVNRVFRATFYPADFVGFEGKTLQPQGKLRISIRQ